jgi:hypothetical protein
MNQSIFVEAPIAGRSIDDQIAVAATELVSVENLLVIGWDKSNGVNLRDRKDALETKIRALEELKARQKFR